MTKIELSTNNAIITNYSYKASRRGPGYTTNMISSEETNGVKYQYIYDDYGNIEEIQDEDGDTLNYYEYDDMGELTYSLDYANLELHEYEYDLSGNLLSETIKQLNSNLYPISTDTVYYGYSDSNWKDKLTSYDGQTITYDAIGNPLQYRDGISMTWKNGRQLATLQKSGHTIGYDYNDENIRVSKTVDGTEYTYEYAGGLLMYETRGTAKFWYYYDANGILYNVKYTLVDGGTTYSYYYTHNSRGDIIGIYTGSGNLVARYEYDDWGKVTSVTDQNGNAITSATHIGNLNPFRYRGYYLDTETGLSYLMSRYYDPVTHRFVNADGYFQSGGGIFDTNMSAYCGNNPVNCYDPFGERYISSTTVRNEDIYERGDSCSYQRYASLKNTTPNLLVHILVVIYILLVQKTVILRLGIMML